MKQKIRQKDLDEGLKSFVSVLKLSSRELKKKTHKSPHPPLRNSGKGNRRSSLHSCDFPALGKVTKGVKRAPMEREQKKMGETTQTC